ncbi:hypothetical protein DN490_30570, partial [Burkholderia multivorans]
APRARAACARIARMVPERGAAPAGASDTGSNGGKRRATFTIGGFLRRCEHNRFASRVRRVNAFRPGAVVE